MSFAPALAEKAVSTSAARNASNLGIGGCEMELSFEHKKISAGSQVVIPVPENRREALRLWMIAHKITFVELGKHLGLTSCGVSQAVSNDRIGVEHHKALVEYGLPPELLPRAEDVSRGPKPKAAQTAQAAGA